MGGWLGVGRRLCILHGRRLPGPHALTTAKRDRRILLRQQAAWTRSASLWACQHMRRLPVTGHARLLPPPLLQIVRPTAFDSFRNFVKWRDTVTSVVWLVLSQVCGPALLPCLGSLHLTGGPSTVPPAATGADSLPAPHFSAGGARDVGAVPGRRSGRGAGRGCNSSHPAGQVRWRCWLLVLGRRAWRI